MKENKLLSSRWYILFLEFWQLPVRQNSKIVGALLVFKRMRVLFLSTETNSRSIFPLNQTTSLIYSHFVQTIPLCSGTGFLSLNYNISSAILELSGAFPELADKVRILTLRKTIPELYRFLLCAEQRYVIINLK